MYNPAYGLQLSQLHERHQPLLQGMQPLPVPSPQVHGMPPLQVHGMHQPLLHGVQTPPNLMPGYEGIGGRNINGEIFMNRFLNQVLFG